MFEKAGKLKAGSVETSGIRASISTKVKKVGTVPSKIVTTNITSVQKKTAYHPRKGGETWRDKRKRAKKGRKTTKHRKDMSMKPKTKKGARWSRGGEEV